MRAWKATMGGTVMERVEQFTFDRARRMLEERQDLPVKTIAGSCGFAGQAAFSTAFRRRFGVSPMTWRQRYRAGRPH
jgi:AraC family transcriptional regulator